MGMAGQDMIKVVMLISKVGHRGLVLAVVSPFEVDLERAHQAETLSFRVRMLVRAV
jgi:hypothetical protein